MSVDLTFLRTQAAIVVSTALFNNDSQVPANLLACSNQKFFDNEPCLRDLSDKISYCGFKLRRRGETMRLG